MPKFAANLTMMFKEYEFLDRFEAAAKAGFKYVEFLWPYDYPAEQIKEKLTKYDLELVLFNTPAGDVGAGEWGVTAVPGKQALAREYIDLACKYAVDLGCKRVHVMAGVVPVAKLEDPQQARTIREQYLVTFVDNVRYAAELFAKHGIQVVLEALSPAVKPNYLLVSQFDTVQAIKLINHPNVYIQLDYFHAQNVDGRLSKFTREYFDQVGHIQLASVPDRHEPDEGEVNYEHLYSLLDELGYKGYIGCEYNPRGKTEDGLAWFKPYAGKK